MGITCNLRSWRFLVPTSTFTSVNTWLATMLPPPAATCTGGMFFSTKQAFTNVCTYKWAHIVTCTVWWWLYVVVIYVLCRCMALEYQLWNWLKPPNAVKGDLATLLSVWSLRYRYLAESSLAKSHFTVLCSPLHESLCISSEVTV